MCFILPAGCHVLYLTCRLSCVLFNLQVVMCFILPAGFHVLYLTCRLSCTVCTRCRPTLAVWSAVVQP